MIERFAVADELTCYYDRPAEPANVHLEVVVPGRLDPAAVSASVAAVLASQPRIMARRRPAVWRRGYHWEFPVPLGTEPVLTASYAGQEDLDRRRDAFLSSSLSLDVAPPLRFLLASGPDGDHLILNAHHAAFDGLSCLRLMREVAGQYGPAVAGGQAMAIPPPMPDADPAPLAASGSPRPATPPLNPCWGQDPSKGSAGETSVSAARRKFGRAARIAPGLEAEPRLPGYGAHLVTWDGLTVTNSLRRDGASINDLLIAALMITISEWNRARGSGDGIKITMPVGDKAQAGPEGQWANLSRLTTIAARVPAGARPADVIADVASQTRAAKEHTGPQLDLASRALAAAPLPVTVKYMLLRLALRVAGPLFCDTSLVSNLGVAGPLAFGPMPAEQVWFSTSAHMPRGLSLGAVTAGGALRLTFRYRRALMSGSDAGEFGAMFAKVLDQFSGEEAVRR
ncbi:MAG TPA: hypothetical protein VHJ18_24410 [Streptosporangiaceae bacterium]|jgi:NRPS condensation-like uncharacterized protein|nr:hypothetical protein [Streptosporangiaceae bacterium]